MPRAHQLELGETRVVALRFGERRRAPIGRDSSSFPAVVPSVTHFFVASRLRTVKIGHVRPSIVFTALGGVGALGVFGALVWPSPWAEGTAHAASRASARFGYSADAASLKCPSEAEMRDILASRLGYDPFVPDAEQVVIVRFERRGARGLAGSFDIQGPKPGHHEIASANNDCRELAETLATAIAIRLDPASLGGHEEPPPLPPPFPAPSSPKVSASVAPEPSQSAPADRSDREKPSSSRPTYLVGIAGSGLAGELPAFTGAVALAAGVRGGHLSASVEGEATLPASRAVGAQTREVSASLLSGAVVPCAHAEMFFGCFVGRLGAFRGEGTGVDVPSNASALYFSAGVRAGLEMRVSEPLYVVVSLEAVAPLTKMALQLSGAEVWSSPSVAGRAALGARMCF